MTSWSTGVSPPVEIDLTISATVTADASLRWRGVGVTLEDDDSDEPLISSGLLASVTDADYDVTVTLGSPSPNPAAPGHSGDADTVERVGLDAPTGETSRLWMTLYLAAGRRRPGSDAPAGAAGHTLTG